MAAAKGYQIKIPPDRLVVRQMLRLAGWYHPSFALIPW